MPKPTYFQMPHNENRYVSWDGNATFQTGRFDRGGSFVPTEEFELSGPCTEQEAWEVAESVFRDDKEMVWSAAIEEGPAGEYENQNHLNYSDRG